VDKLNLTQSQLLKPNSMYVNGPYRGYTYFDYNTNVTVLGGWDINLALEPRTSPWRFVPIFVYWQGLEPVDVFPFQLNCSVCSFLLSRSSCSFSSPPFTPVFFDLPFPLPLLLFLRLSSLPLLRPSSSSSSGVNNQSSARNGTSVRPCPLGSFQLAG